MTKRSNKPLAIKRLMESDVLAQAFVLEAIMRYAQETVDAPEWKGTSFIHQSAWRRVAQAALETVSVA